MGWRDSYRPGSFRGVEFRVEAHDHAFGRRCELHEYPKRDEPYAEDLGRKAREFSLDLYVIGPDYMAARDRLREALEKEGPGTLVHPYLGSQQVQVRDASLRESSREGGMARFRVTFVEAGRAAEPRAEEDTAYTVSRRAEESRGAALDDFLDRLDVSGPEFVRSNVLSSVSRRISALTWTASRVSGSGLGSWFSRASLLEGSLSGLITSPLLLGRGLLSLFTGLGEDTDPATTYAVSTRSLSGLAADVPAVFATPERSRVASNDAAVAELMGRAAVIEAAEASSRREYACADEALAARGGLSEALEDMSLAASDPVYATLTALRASVVRDLGSRAADLPSLAVYTPPVTTPALVVAHRVYGDAARADEIVSRNPGVRHPGAVLGGTPLEVLTDAY